MNSKLIKQKLVVSVMIGCLAFSTQKIMGEASELASGIPTNVQLMISEQYYGKAFADIDANFIYIRSEATQDSSWVGKLYQDNEVEIIASSADWVEIESGSVIGYVESKYLLTGTSAEIRAKEIGSAVVDVQAHALNVRKGPGTDYDVVDVIHDGDIFTVSGAIVDGWYPILYGTDIYYVSGDYVQEDIVYSYAESKEEEEVRLKEFNQLLEKAVEDQQVAQIAEQVAAVEALGTSSYVSGSYYLIDGDVTGTSIVEFASQFVGNPYVWGGTDLMHGADCSGFVQSVYKEFGYNLPRTSAQQRSAGVKVESYEDIQIGDIICYDGHVGIYIGNDKIINAIGRKSGIGISSATYKSYITIRRIL